MATGPKAGDATARAALLASRFRELLTTAMEAKGITVSALAELSTVSERTIRYYRGGRWNNKEQRPNAEKIAELALALGMDPDHWCSQAGISLPPSQLERAIKVVMARGESKGDKPTSPILNFVERERIVKAGFFSQQGLTRFFRAYFKLLVGLLDPDWMVDDASVQSATVGLNQLETTDLHALLGAYEVPRRLKRIDFIPYPGLCTRLSIVQMVASERLTWADLFRGKKGDYDVLLVTATGDPAEALMRGVFNYAPTKRNISTVPRYDHAVLWQALTDLQRQSPNSCPAIIIDEYMAREIQIHYADEAVINDTDAEVPLFRLGMGVARVDPAWGELIERTQSLMFSSAPEQFLRIYLDLVDGLGFRSLRDLAGLRVIDVSLVTGLLRSKVFVKALVDGVAGIIRSKLEVELTSLSVASTPSCLLSRKLRCLLEGDTGNPAPLESIVTLIADAWLNNQIEGR